MFLAQKNVTEQTELGYINFVQMLEEVTIDMMEPKMMTAISNKKIPTDVTLMPI